MSLVSCYTGIYLYIVHEYNTMQIYRRANIFTSKFILREKTNNKIDIMTNESVYEYYQYSSKMAGAFG